MKESYGEGLANHIGPESCGGDSKGRKDGDVGSETTYYIRRRKSYTVCHSGLD